MEGRGWRKHLSKLPRLSFLSRLVPAKRAASAALLLLVFLVPYSSALVALTGLGASACAMSCCKGAKACCCRRSDKNVHRESAGWTAPLQCRGGCDQLPAVPGTLSASLAASSAEVNLVLPAAPLRASAASPRASFECGLVLFGRPPPSV